MRLGVVSVLVTVVALLIGVYWQTSLYSQAAQQKVNEITDTNLADITTGVYNLIEAQGESLQQQVDNNLRVAEYVLGQSGLVNLSKETVLWKASNQYNQAVVDVQLPKVYIGDAWLKQNRDMNVRTPVVDHIIDMVGGTCTLFQRMNPAGDMLRVATNVQGKDGKRAIGTYIPATNPDGTVNPVIATVLKGETYHGTAFVVDAWYLAAYEPIRNTKGEVIGMSYVGVKQENIQSLRGAIREAKVGLNGLVFVLSGSADKRGNYIISPNGKQDGESALGIKDANGQSPIETILATAKNLNQDQIKVVRYLEPSLGAAAPRWMVNYVSYYRPWDWVIVSQVYEDELLQYQTTLRDGLNRMMLVTSLIGLGIALIVALISFLATHSMVRPLLHLTDIASQISAGNIDLQAHVLSNDEIGHLAKSFNTMTARLRDLLRGEQQQRLRLQQTVRRYADHIDRVSRGNLSERVAIDAGEGGQDDPLVMLGERLNQMTASLQEMIQQVWEAVHNLKIASAEILAATSQQASSASEQSAAVSQAATTVGEIKTIAQQNSLRSQEVADAAQRTVDVSRNGKQAVENTIESMHLIKGRVEGIAEQVLVLSEQALQIGEIITTVSEIASQSNMLALNAAIEAARAGDQGRGFGAVALEVRRLAEQSKNATVQVETILSEIQKAINTSVMTTEEGAKGVEMGVQQVAQSKMSIERLSAAIDQSANNAIQIVAGGQQQAAGMEQIAQAMEQISQAAVQALASTRQAEDSAQNLDLLARKLTASVEQYQL